MSPGIAGGSALGEDAMCTFVCFDRCRGGLGGALREETQYPEHAPVRGVVEADVESLCVVGVGGGDGRSCGGWRDAPLRGWGGIRRFLQCVAGESERAPWVGVPESLGWRVLRRRVLRRGREMP
mmetsp:Transcript_33832/g.85549  ORF Transcript_33832/g.85549 Transcript_33832/m.85549 type:complete len:124 (+) Transcript_33832:163-534(+)